MEHNTVRAAVAPPYPPRHRGGCNSSRKGRAGEQFIQVVVDCFEFVE